METSSKEFSPEPREWLCPQRNGCLVLLLEVIQLNRSVVFGLFLTVGCCFMSPSIASAQKIVAHRGASHDAPENTLAAFRLAWEQNADAIEGDYYLTKDKQIVCIHDANTKRTADKELVIAESTLAELKQLDFGSWKDPRFKDERIPTLSEVLATVPAGKHVLIEIKCGPEIVPFLPPVLKQSGLQPEQTIVICFSDKVIAATREQIPEIKAHWLTGLKKNSESGKYEPSIETILKKAAEIRATGVDIQANREVVDEAFVKQLRSHNLEFHVWTVNDPADAFRFQQLSVDSITTDRPAFLRTKLGLK